MNVSDGMNILREIKDVAFATVDKNGLPQIRIIDIMIVEDEKIYFCTARGKAFYKQLEQDGNVAITGMNQKYQMVRVSGTAKKLEEQGVWMKRIFKENPSMEYVYPGESRKILEAFCISSGNLEFFDLGNEPPKREFFTFGGETMEQSGYVINENCINCGKCIEVCPSQCIQEAKQCYINQENCLHCGLCEEICPIGAIVEKNK